MDASALESLFEYRAPPGVPMVPTVRTANARTRRELALVAAGRKPMAMYSLSRESVDARLDSYRMIIDLADKLRLLVIHSLSERDAMVFVTRADQVWRAQAFNALFEVDGDWSERAERLSSYLLGYSKEQTDEWLAYQAWRFPDRHGATIFFLLSRSQHDQIAIHGHTCLPSATLEDDKLIAFWHRRSRAVIRRDAHIRLPRDLLVGRAAFQLDFFRSWFTPDRLPDGLLVATAILDKLDCPAFNAALESRIEILGPDGWGRG